MVSDGVSVLSDLGDAFDGLAAFFFAPTELLRGFAAVDGLAAGLAPLAAAASSSGAVFGAVFFAARLRTFFEGSASAGGASSASLALASAGAASAAFAGAGWLAPEFGLLQGYEVQDAENYRMLPANAITNRAIAWLEKVPCDEPVHLLVNYFDPHDPYAPPPGYDVFNPQDRAIRLPERFGEEKPNAAQVSRIRDLYDAEIRFMDVHLGRLLDALRASGRYDDALIIVTADHGELLGEHGHTGHGAWLWEELLRIPLLIHYPGARDAGSESEALVSIVDILPLISDELTRSLPLPEGVDGVALGERDFALAEEFPSALFAKLGGPALDRELYAGIRWPWKLIVSSRGGSELYRLDRDPGEVTHTENERVVRDLEQRIVDTRAALERPAPSVIRLSPEAQQNLRELGYID